MEVSVRDQRRAVSLSEHPFMRRDGRGNGKISYSVVIPAREDSDFVLNNLVNKTVLLIYPAGPTAFKFMLQWLRLSDSTEGITLKIFLSD